MLDEAVTLFLNGESETARLMLEKYKKLLGEIEETENQLKSELAGALAHHFTAEAAE